VFILPTASSPKQGKVNILPTLVTHPCLIITFLFHSTLTIIQIRLITIVDTNIQELHRNVMHTLNGMRYFKPFLFITSTNVHT